MVTALIPRDILFADPDKSFVKLSPNGRMVSFLAPYQGCLNLWIAPLDKPRNAVPITQHPEPIHDYEWSADSTQLLYLQDQGGDENWQLKGIDVTGQQPREYTPKGAQARILQITRNHPHEIAIALNKRDPALHDVYHCDLKSGNLTRIYENHHYWDFVVDRDLQLRAGIKIDAIGGAYVQLQSPNPQTPSAEESILIRLSQLDILALYYYPRLKMGLSDDTKTLYISHSLETNTAGLCAVNLQTDTVDLLGIDLHADLFEVLFDPISHKPLAFSVIHDRKQWTVIDSNVEKDMTFLNALDDGDLAITGQSHDNQHWIVAYTHDNDAIRYYHYNRTEQQATLLFTSCEPLADYPLTRMYAKSIPTQDHLHCMSYLSIPMDQDKQQNGIPSEPLPLIVLVHGGPHYRDFWGYNPWHQWLANRGYAVLSVNYRSSTGFGKAHMRAGNGEWAGKIQQDLLDAKAWAIAHRITTEDKVAVMGRSFGGYMTLAGLTMTPEAFCCGVDMMGFANLETLLAHVPPYWKAVRKAFIEMLGCDPDTPEGKAFLAERSPIHYADRIQRPLLIAHGGNDPRVLRSESDHMAAAMQHNHIPVTYVVFPDEGHQLSQQANREAFHALAEVFFAQHLGGRYEGPPSLKLQRTGAPSSMQVIVDDFNLIRLR